MDVIGFGALNYDFLFEVERIASSGDEVAIKHLKGEPGGSAANTIAGLGRMGIKCGFVGCVGRDGEGEAIIADFKNYGVDTEGIKTKKDATGRCLGFVDAIGERTLYIYPGANNLLEYTDVDRFYLNSARIVHLTSFVHDLQFEIQKKIVKKCNVKVSFSPGELYCKKGLDALKPLIEKTDILFLNEKEVGMLITESVGSYIAGAEALSDMGIGIVVVTLGKEGVYIKTGDKECHVPSLKTDVIDTTGAGDAFAAGFLYGIINRRDIEVCGKLGNFAASRCIAKTGAREGLPLKNELKGIDQV